MIHLLSREAQLLGAKIEQKKNFVTEEVAFRFQALESWKAGKPLNIEKVIRAGIEPAISLFAIFFPPRL